MFNKAVPELPDNIIDQFYHGQEISLLSFLKVHRGYAAQNWLMSEGFSVFFCVYGQNYKDLIITAAADIGAFYQKHSKASGREERVDKGSVVPVTKSHKE